MNVKTVAELLLKWDFHTLHI